MAIPRAGYWHFFHESEAGWVDDGLYAAPVKETSIKDGRASTHKFSRAVDGSEMVSRQPVRSTKKGTVLRFWMHHTGAERAIFDYLNWAIETGVGLKMETHVGIDLMGYLEDVSREWMNWSEKDGQMFKVTAPFRFFPVDGTGTGW